MLPVLVGIYLARHGGTDVFDRWGFSWVPVRYHSRALLALSYVGNPFVVGCGAVIAGAVAARSDLRRAIACLAGPSLAGVLTEFVLKPWVGSHTGHLLSFPSGHTTGAAALAAVVVLVLPTRWRWAAVPAAVALVAGAAVAVVSLGWHTPSQSLAGAAVGSGSVLLVDGLLQGLGARARTRRAAAGGQDARPAPGRG